MIDSTELPCSFGFAQDKLVEGADSIPLMGETDQRVCPGGHLNRLAPGLNPGASTISKSETLA